MLNAAAAGISLICLIWYFNSGSMTPLIIMTVLAPSSAIT